MCVPLIRMCCLSGRTSVSRCKCGIGVVFVQPVAIRSAVFCVVWSFWMCVSAVSGCQAVCAYERMGLMYCLYICVMSSLE